MKMKSSIVVELSESEIEIIKQGHYVTQTIPTYAKEKDERGGLFRKLAVNVIVQKEE